MNEFRINRKPPIPGDLPPGTRDDSKSKKKQNPPQGKEVKDEVELSDAGLEALKELLEREEEKK